MRNRRLFRSRKNIPSASNVPHGFAHRNHSRSFSSFNQDNESDVCVNSELLRQSIAMAYPFVATGTKHIMVYDTLPSKWWNAFGYELLSDIKSALFADGRRQYFLSNGILGFFDACFIWIGSLVSSSVRLYYEQHCKGLVKQYHLYKCCEKLGHLEIDGGFDSGFEDDLFGDAVYTPCLDRVIKKYEKRASKI